MRGRDAWTWLVAPVLLTLVAGYQFHQVATHDQSSWSGVGFGMFATLDYESTRAVRIEVELGNATLPAEPSSLGERRLALRALPRAADVADAARSLLSERWTVIDGVARPAAAGDPADAVTVSVVGLELAGTDDAPVVRVKPIAAERVAR